MVLQLSFVKPKKISPKEKKVINISEIIPIGIMLITCNPEIKDGIKKITHNIFYNSITYFIVNYLFLLNILITAQHS